MLYSSKIIMMKTQITYVMYSFCNQCKYLHIKLGLNYGKCPYLVQKFTPSVHLVSHSVQKQKQKNLPGMVIMLLEKSKSCIHSVITVNTCILNKALITVKYPYLVQRSHHQPTLFFMVCHSENLKTYKIWLFILRK